jgi:hypothetical protein
MDWLDRARNAGRLLIARGAICISLLGRACRRRDARRARVDALVFVDDAFEEGIEEVAAPTEQLGRHGVPAFMFQEGADPKAERAFRTIARLTRGAYCRFDVGSAHQLAELLRAVAVYAAGGVTALTARRDEGARRLLTLLKDVTPR